MCFFHKHNSKLLIAKKDIKVFKVVNITNKGSLISKYYRFKYILNKIYNYNFFKFEKLPKNQGFHSFLREPIYDKKCFLIVAKKFYYFGIYEVYYYNKDIIIECIIPKGTKYYSNGTDCISESIKPVQIIFNNELTDNKIIKIIKKYYPNIKTIK